MLTFIICVIFAAILWTFLLKNSAIAELVKTLLHYPKLWVCILGCILGLVVILSPAILFLLLNAVGFKAISGPAILVIIVIVGIALVVLGLKL